MARAHDPGTPDSLSTLGTTSTPTTAAPATAPATTRQRTGWVIAVTLAALAVLIVVILYAIDVL